MTGEPVSFSVTYASSTPGTLSTIPRIVGKNPAPFAATVASRRASNAARLSTVLPTAPDDTATVSHPGIA